MAKIKKTDISKLTKLEQQIEELKIQKKQQEEELAKNIGNHFMSNIDIDDLESAEDLYSIIDEVLEKFNNTNNNNEFEKESVEPNESKDLKEETQLTNRESEVIN